MNLKLLYLVLYSVFLLTIFILAYIGLIPSKLIDVPHYDSIGHFVLYGLWGFFFGGAFNKIVATINRLKIQQGIIIIIPIAITEELLQLFFPIREFSMFDMIWGISGIITACFVLNARRFNPTKVVISTETKP